MAGQVFLIVDSVNSSAVIQPGQPPTTVAAYVLNVPDGQTGEDVAKAFFREQRFPLNSAAYIVDATLVAAYVAESTLTPAPGLTNGTATPP